MANTTTNPKPRHIAILPTPGMGHLIPLVQFAKRLHNLHNITSTFVLPTDGPLSSAHSSFLSSLPSGIDYVLLPPVTFEDLPDDTKVETIISLTITRSLPAIHDAVRSLHESKNLVALVVDLFGTDGFEVALEVGIPKYIFFPSNALSLSLFLHLPELDRTTLVEYRDLTEKVKLSGCVPLHGRDLLDPVQDRGNEAYKWVLHHAKRYEMADGILINTFKELEPRAIEALQVKTKPIVRAIGPLIQMESKKREEPCVCLDWLDEQPSSSVLFISFGSGGTLSHDQIIELALGLELSEHRFLWVLRTPNDKTANATYFSINNSGDPLAYLPEGFLERTKGKGLVVPMWAPQAQILAHESTGAFLSHCGWNSSLESVVNGVPLIAWPLYAEQRMNAVLLHEDVKIALRPKIGEKGLVGRVEIANVVKGLMEGEEGKGIRSRTRDLKDAAAKNLSENGCSTKALAEFVNKWKSNATT